jgi:hypothetical protein
MITLIHAARGGGFIRSMLCGMVVVHMDSPTHRGMSRHQTILKKPIDIKRCALYFSRTSFGWKQESEFNMKNEMQKAFASRRDDQFMGSLRFHDVLQIVGSLNGVNIDS